MNVFQVLKFITINHQGIAPDQVALTDLNGKPNAVMTDLLHDILTKVYLFVDLENIENTSEMIAKLSAVTPFYYPFSFEEIKQYYFDIIEATQNKMIIYAIPDLTGVNISINQFEELFNNEKIVGVKYTAPNFFLLERIREAFPDKLILSGFDEMLVQAVISGVDGAIGSTYNVNGRRARQIYDLAREGKVEEAYKIQHDTNNIIETVLSMGIYPTLKEILKTRGIDGGVPKRPFSPFNEANRKELNQLIETYNL